MPQDVSKFFKAIQPIDHDDVAEDEIVEPKAYKIKVLPDSIQKLGNGIAMFEGKFQLSSSYQPVTTTYRTVTGEEKTQQLEPIPFMWCMRLLWDHLGDNVKDIVEHYAEAIGSLTEDSNALLKKRQNFKKAEALRVRALDIRDQLYDTINKILEPKGFFLMEKRGF